MMRSRFAFALIALAASGPALADVRAGVAAWARKDYAAAIAEWRGPAAAGDADAQYNLGQAYRRGEGVKKDAGEAESWYRKAAAKGHPQAQAALGLLLFQSGDKTAAMPWFQKAAARGEPRAQYVVGTALFNADGLAKDWPRAYAMMSRAAAAGLQPATLSLGQMETYLSATEKRQGAALAKTLASAETLSAAARRSRGTAVGGAPARGTTKPAVETAEAEAAPAKGKTKAAAAKADDTPAKPKRAATDAAPAKGWKVQLGAFGAESAARTHWTKLAKSSAFAGLDPA